MKKLTVGDAMTQKPVRASPEDTIVEAARVMEKKGISSLPVCVGPKLVGFVTAEDIVKRAVAKGKDAKKTKLKEVMTTKPITTEKGIELTDAMKVLSEKNIKRLVVVDGQKLVGVVTDGDILRVAPGLIEYLYEEIEKLKEDVGAAGAADVCESCGNYSTDLRVTNGELLCVECRETNTYI